MSNLILIIPIAVLLVMSAFFSASEIAFSSANMIRLKNRKKNNGSIGHLTAMKILENYDEYLSTILIGNNIANMALSSLATIIVVGIFKSDDYTWVSTLSMTVLVLIFGEIIPKVLAKQMPESFCVVVALPVYILSIILKPLNIVVVAFVNLLSKLWKSEVSDSEAVSEDDFESIIEIVEDEGVLDEEQCDLLQNALDFDEVLAYEIITHRVDLEALDIRDPYEVNIKKCCETTFSRLPVFEDNADMNFIRTYVNEAVKKCGGMCGVFAGNDSDGYKYIVASEHIDLKEISAKMKAQLSCRGGGSSVMIQGSSSATKTKIEDFFKNN